MFYEIDIRGEVCTSPLSLLHRMKTIHIFLQSFHKGTHVITIADRVVYLDGQGKEPLSVPFKELAHGKNRQQELAFVKTLILNPVNSTQGTLEILKELAGVPSLGV